MRVTEIVRLATQPIEKLLIPQETSPLMLQGSLYHAHILRHDTNGVPDIVDIIQADSYRTKQAQEARDSSLASDRLPCLAKDWEAISSTPESTMQALHSIFKADKFELELHGKVKHFGEIVGHLDSLNGIFVSDLKISQQNDRLDKKIFDYGYQLQMFLYMELAQVEQAKLVFFNPQANAIFTKELCYYDLLAECEALLDKAYRNYCQLNNIAEKGVYVESSSYNPPQWVLSELLEAESNQHKGDK